MSKTSIIDTTPEPAATQPQPHPQAEAATATEKVHLVRIRPNLKCNSFNQFDYGDFGERGNVPQWYRVDSSLAGWCRERRLSDGKGVSPLVFDVIEGADPAEAATKALELDERYLDHQQQPQHVEQFYVREGWNGHHTLFGPEHTRRTYQKTAAGSPWTPLQPR